AATSKTPITVHLRISCHRDRGVFTSTGRNGRLHPPWFCCPTVCPPTRRDSRPIVQSRYIAMILTFAPAPWQALQPSAVSDAEGRKSGPSRPLRSALDDCLPSGGVIGPPAVPCCSQLCATKRSAIDRTFEDVVRYGFAILPITSA